MIVSKRFLGKLPTLANPSSHLGQKGQLYLVLIGANCFKLFILK
jgi:hypothetical protein